MWYKVHGYTTPTQRVNIIPSIHNRYGSSHMYAGDMDGCIMVRLNNFSRLEQRKWKQGTCPENLLPSWQLHQIKLWVRLDQKVLQYTHNERSIVIRPKTLNCGPVKFNKSPGRYAEMPQYATAMYWYYKDTLTRYLPRLEVHSTCNFHSVFWVSTFADLGNQGHPAVWLLQQNSL